MHSLGEDLGCISGNNGRNLKRRWQTCAKWEYLSGRPINGDTPDLAIGESPEVQS
jgi:hypothetical protein